jgi:preprotein translocase subunit Sec61beta
LHYFENGSYQVEIKLRPEIIVYAARALAKAVLNLAD